MVTHIHPHYNSAVRTTESTENPGAENGKVRPGKGPKYSSVRHTREGVEVGLVQITGVHHPSKFSIAVASLRVS